MDSVRKVLNQLREFGEMLKSTYNALEGVVSEIGKVTIKHIFTATVLVKISSLS